MDTVEANLQLGFAPDARDYKIAAEILSFLNLKTIKLLTNNPEKSNSLNQAGIEIEARIPLLIPHQENKHYLLVKKQKMGHLIDEQFLQ